MSSDRGGRAAVLGKPVAHSLSPVIHNAGYQAAGLAGWSYTAIECAEAELADLVAGLGPEWAGLSLTMPLKEAALAVANEVSPVAAAVGAANTLVRRADGSWYADNTDVPGMVESLRAAGVTRAGSVAVLGAGGTARAALAAARELSPQTITVYARRPEAIEQLRTVRVGREGGRESDRVGREGGWGSDRAGRDGGRESDPVPLTAAPWIDAARCGEADVVISTVPKGVADQLAVDWRPSTVLFDVLYDPWPTPLAASAQAAGCRIVSGLDLLLAQAVGQFEQFTGVPAPVAAMRAALEQARR